MNGCVNTIVGIIILFILLTIEGVVSIDTAGSILFFLVKAGLILLLIFLLMSIAFRLSQIFGDANESGSLFFKSERRSSATARVNSKEKNQKFSLPSRSGNETITFALDEINRRRLRGKGDVFDVRLWYADRIDKIIVYPKEDNSSSSRGIGVIPADYSDIIVPFAEWARGYKYSGTFNSNDEVLTLHLETTGKAEIKEKDKEQKDREKKAQERRTTWREQYPEMIKKKYKPRKDITFEAYIDNDLVKYRRKISNLEIRFAEKDAYLDPDFTEGELLENGKFLTKIKLPIKVIRMYHSGHPIKIVESEIIREYSTWIRMRIELER